jgi:hypothetical protein
MSWIMVLISFGLSISLPASGKNSNNCESFLETPNLYNDCLKINIAPIKGTIPQTLPDYTEEEGCSICDDRHRHRDEKRLKNKNKKIGDE